MNATLSPITQEQFSEIAPAVLAPTPAPSTSKKYSYIPTTKVVSMMETLGWFPVKVKQSSSRKPNGQRYAKHIIWFRQAGDMSADKDSIIKELKVINSHNGSCALIIECGLCRVVCGNQLAVAIKELYRIAIKHIGFSQEEITDLLNKVIANFETIMQRVDDYQKIKLSEEEQLEIARRAIHIRWGEKAPSIEAQQLLDYRRPEDSANDLFTVYNRVQENIIRSRADLTYRNAQNKVRKVRAVRGLDADERINKELWMVLEAVRYSRITQYMDRFM